MADTAAPDARYDADEEIDQSRLQPLLGWHVMQADLHLGRKLIEHLAPFALRPVDFFILVLIDSNHGINQRQIGSALGISAPNLVGVISRLIRKRLLRRVRSRSDRRVQHLHLTRLGGERLHQSEAVIQRFERTLSAQLPDHEKIALQNALQQILLD